MTVVSSAEVAAEELRKQKWRLILWETPLPPLSDRQVLLNKGSFASPRITGTSFEASRRLTCMVNMYLENLPKSVSNDIASHTRFFARLANSRWVQTQLCVKDPREPLAGYTAGSEEFHIDYDQRDKNINLVRLIRVYLGPCTEWIPDSTDSQLYSEQAGETQFMNEVGNYQVPEGWVVLMHGGCKRGVLHRSPVTVNPRAILTVTTLFD